MATTEPQCQFPLFRSKFFGAAIWANSEPHSLSGMDIGGGHDPSPDSQNHLQRPNLKSLDLRALPREDGPVSETQLRRQKYQFFEKQCSRIEEGLYLSGDSVARSRDLLAANGITHVLNCVGFICKEYFKDQLTYRTYYLHDTPGEDILTVLYDALEFIDDALKGGGRVLVHCSQGVSRSATLVIAYLMWKSGRSYDEVYSQVKDARGVANPNIGFTCQLLQWQKRRALQAPARTRLYRMAPHCPQAPLTLVAKGVPAPKQYPNNTYRELDRRGAFVIHTPTRIYTWIGSACPPACAAAARFHAKLLLKYEHVQLLQQRQGNQEPAILEVQQGAEPAELLGLLDPPALDPEAARLNARRASIAEELATSSTECKPAGAEPMEVCSIQIGVAQPSRGSGMASASVSLAGAVQGGGFGGSHASRPQSQSGSTTPRQGCWVVGDVDEYTQEFRMYNDAVRLSAMAGGEATSAGGTASAVMEGVPGIRTTLRSASSIGPDSPAAAAAAAAMLGPSFGLMDSLTSRAAILGPGLAMAGLMEGVPSRPDSPATQEGRMKKYRRSESELRIAIAHKGHPHPLPSLHTSLGDEDMGML